MQKNATSEHRLSIGPISRREMLERTGMGMGALALASLLGESAGAAESGGGAQPVRRLRAPHFPAKAKHVIHLFMNGGPSHVDTFDPKPALAKYEGKNLPFSLPTERKTGTAFPSPFAFQKYGQSGIEVSDLFPHTARCIDDITVVRSMVADIPNHEPSLLLMNCGEARLPRPSMGSWLTYGLGTENQNLPGFVVLCPGGLPVMGRQNWQSAFLPGVIPGHVHRSPDHRRQQTDRAPDQRAFDGPAAAPAARPAGGTEPAASGQPRARTAARRSDSIVRAGLTGCKPRPPRLSICGTNRSTCSTCTDRAFKAGRCCWPGGWSNAAYDSFSSGTAPASPGTRTATSKTIRNWPNECDQAIGALLTDLKQRGLLDETLVLWGGEFGRTPVVRTGRPKDETTTITASACGWPAAE